MFAATGGLADEAASPPPAKRRKHSRAASPADVAELAAAADGKAPALLIALHALEHSPGAGTEMSS